MLVSSWIGDAGAESVLLCWHSRCRLKSTLRWKARSHIPHLNGLYPECLRMWVIRFELWLNDFKHTTHLCGFSPAIKKKNNKKGLVCFSKQHFYFEKIPIVIQWTFFFHWARAISLIFFFFFLQKPHSDRCDSDFRRNHQLW